METTNLIALSGELLKAAHEASSGRAAHTVHGGHEHALRQTVMALAGGRQLAEHESPGEATLQVIAGSVRLNAGESSWTGVVGDHVTIPPRRHSLDALEDSVILLTVVTTPA